MYHRAHLLPIRYRQNAPVIRVRVKQPDGSVSGSVCFCAINIHTDTCIYI